MITGIKVRCKPWKHVVGEKIYTGEHRYPRIWTSGTPGINSAVWGPPLLMEQWPVDEGGRLPDDYSADGLRARFDACQVRQQMRIRAELQRLGTPLMGTQKQYFDDVFAGRRQPEHDLLIELLEEFEVYNLHREFYAD